MKKLLLFLVSLSIFLVMILPCFAYICQDVTNIVDIPCQVTTPVIGCSNYTYLVKSLTNNGTTVDSGSLIPIGNTSSYYFFFNQPLGNYAVQLCDNSTSSIVVSDVLPSGSSPTTTMPYTFGNSKNPPVCPNSGLLFGIDVFLIIISCAIILMALLIKNKFLNALGAMSCFAVFYVLYNFVACYPSPSLILIALDFLFFIWLCIRTFTV